MSRVAAGEDVDSPGTRAGSGGRAGGSPLPGAEGLEQVVADGPQVQFEAGSGAAVVQVRAQPGEQLGEDGLDDVGAACTGLCPGEVSALLQVLQPENLGTSTDQVTATLGRSVVAGTEGHFEAGVHVSPDAWAAQAAQPLADAADSTHSKDVWMFGIGLSLLNDNHD